jgi:hypothetical protein
MRFSKIQIHGAINGARVDGWFTLLAHWPTGQCTVKLSVEGCLPAHRQRYVVVMVTYLRK